MKKIENMGRKNEEWKRHIPKIENMGRKNEEWKRHIPNDVIFNILPRLPAKSLVRFKCVCKAWYSFITQLKYHNHKLILSTKSSIYSIDFEANTIEPLGRKFPFRRRESVKLIGSCNGLLCILHERQVDEAVIVLWNPWTGRHIKESISRPQLDNDIDTFGFGYDHSTDDYQIVTLIGKVNITKNRTTYFKVYSLKRRTWKSGRLPWYFSLSEEPGTCLDGAIYWRMNNVVDSYNQIFGDSRVVLRFDLKDPKKSSVILPPEDVGKKPDFDLCDYGGHLCLVRYRMLNGNCRSGRIDMWMWEKNWIKLMSIPRPKELNSKHYLAPVFFLSSDEILMRLRYRRYRDRVRGRKMGKKQFFIYSPKDDAIRDFKVNGTEKFYFRKEMTYTHRLVSLRRVNTG